MAASNVTQLKEYFPDSKLSEEAEALLNFTRKGARLPKKSTKESIVDEFNQVFGLIGGVPRLAIWADQNPGQFYQLYSKLLPAAIKAEVSLPSLSQLDGMTPDQLKELSTEQVKLILLTHAHTVRADEVVIE